MHKGGNPSLSHTQGGPLSNHLSHPCPTTTPQTHWGTDAKAGTRQTDCFTVAGAGLV